MPRECPMCGEVALARKRGTFRIAPPPSVPGGTIEVQKTSWDECSACGEQIILPPLRRSLDRAVQRRHGLLSSAEIRAVRERSGLSQAEIARRLGVGEKTYTRWEAGRSVQNRSSDNLIRLIDQDPGAFARLEAQRRPDRRETIASYIRLLGEIKGRDDHAVAAHGIEVGHLVSKELRERLRRIIKAQEEGS